jgi:type II secretory pathway pseudopilin PulG
MESSRPWWHPILAMVLHPLGWFVTTIGVILIFTWILGMTTSPSSGPEPWLGEALAILILASPLAYAFLLMRLGGGWRLALLRLLTLLAVAAFVASVAIPNLLGAIDRGKQKRTLSDMREIAAEVAAFRRDHPGDFRANSMEELSVVLGRRLPNRDPWGNAYVVRCDRAHEFIRSFGRDGRQTGGSSPTDYVRGPTSRFEDDIIFEDGAFTVYPNGTQREFATSPTR